MTIADEIQDFTSVELDRALRGVFWGRATETFRAEPLPGVVTDEGDGVFIVRCSVVVTNPDGVPAVDSPRSEVLLVTVRDGEAVELRLGGVNLP